MSNLPNEELSRAYIKELTGHDVYKLLNVNDCKIEFTFCHSKNGHEIGANLETRRYKQWTVEEGRHINVFHSFNESMTPSTISLSQSVIHQIHKGVPNVYQP